MRLVEIAKQDNGAHRNNTIVYGAVDKIPEGWAVIPDEMETENFPFGELTAIDVEGVMTVIEWIPGVKTEPEEEAVM